MVMAMCPVLTGCGVPLVTYNAAEIQQEKYLYDSKRYQNKTTSQLQTQFSAYKARCGLLPAMDHSMNFEKISDNEHALFVQYQGGDGVITVIRATETNNDVKIQIWSRAPRVAKYIVNAIENGQCKSSVWD